jgi:hypothetical protein
MLIAGSACAAIWAPPNSHQIGSDSSLADAAATAISSRSRLTGRCSDDCFPDLRRAGAKVGFGAGGRVPAAKAERPLSVQSRDLRGDVGQRARRPTSAVRGAAIEPPESTQCRRSRPRERVVRATRKRSFASDFWSYWRTGSCQFVEKRLCLFQIGGVEALGEPAVDRRQQIDGHVAVVSLGQHSRQRRGGAQCQ